MTEGIAWIPLTFVVLIIVATVWLGIYATKKATSASDFFVAGRSVSVFWNASAISGEYLSAASFMGIAGLLMKNGYDALWYPVGYATGYLLLLLFIAGPLRRFGAYTIPDFAEGRFDSPTFRKIAVIFVLFIGFFYTMPQMKGAGVTMATILNWPYAVGIVVVGGVITFNVALGGMKGITFVQAFQYWAKVFAISVPVFILMSVYGGYPTNVALNVDAPKGAPKLGAETKVSFKGKAGAPANAVAFAAGPATRILFPTGAALDKVSPARKLEPGEDPLPAGALVVLQGETVVATSPVGGWKSGFAIPAGAALESHPYAATRAGQPLVKAGQPLRNAAKIEFLNDTSGLIAAGSAVPNAQANKKWSEPFGTMTGKYGYPLLYTYSLILALVCGTAGLPHILVRFYTNPDGRSAKRTTLWVMVLIGVFYLFPPVWGAIGRNIIPMLYANNTTDSVVIKLPMALTDNKLLGQILSGITSAGAFAAFMSTFSGLLVSMSGALAHDIYGNMLRPNASQADRMKAFKVAAVLCGIVSVLLGLLVQSFDIAMMVGSAFAIAAASYFPLLLLGAWWRGLTKQGAATGMLVGGLMSLAAIVCSMAIDKKLLVWDVDPQIRTLMEQPAIWGVPLSIGVMVLVSLATAHSVPKDIALKMLRLHAPEELGVSKNYIDAEGDH
jgi:cation/acetate symporter